MDGLTRTVLDNGLRIAVVEDHSAPVVSLMVWVRVGSADERPDQAGMAHVFEHMLFKGTERRGVGEIAATIEAAGGNVNAFTSFDMTAYFATMASRDAAVGIDVLADALQHSSFDPTELAREEEVVIEEIRRSNDSPGRALSQAVFEAAYSAHPYRLPVIGTEQSVRSFTREGLLEFFHHWYVPNNMTFVVVGDIDTAKAIAQIREAFAAAKPDRALEHPRTPEPAPSAAMVRVVESEFQQTLLGIAYKITGFEDQDTPYLDLLSSVLGGGDSSRLYRSVKDRQQLVHSIHTSSYTPLDDGLFMIDAALDPSRISASVRAIAEEVHRIRDLGPNEAELERARVNLLASKVHERETMDGQANNLGYYETIGGGIEREPEYLEAVRRATTEDLRRVAREYLAPERARVVALLEKDATVPTTASLITALEDGSGTGRRRVAGTEVAPGIWRYELPSGLRVIVKPVHSVPLVSLHLALRGGQLAESAERQGISTFLAEMLERGTEQRSAAQFAAEAEDIAGSLSGFAGRNSFGVQAKFLKDSLDTGLELLADVVLRPALDPNEIEKVREESLAAIKRREDSLTSKAFELLNKGLYSSHPYSFLTLGTEQSVAAIDREALRAYWDAYAHPANAVLSVVGDVDPEAAVEAIGSHLREWRGPQSVSIPHHDVPALSQSQELSIAKQRSQMHLMVGFPGLRVGDPDVPALHVLTQVLSGQGGRLFLELRDRQSLAYQVMAQSVEGLDPGTFMVYIASAPEKEEQAREGVKSELARLLEGGIADAELERARSYLVGSYSVSLQRFGTQASLLSLDELYGLGATYHLGYRERIEKVTREDVMRVARRIIDFDRAVYAVVR